MARPSETVNRKAPYRRSRLAVECTQKVTVKVTALVRNALSATAVVTSYRVVGKYAPRFGKGVPVFKYEFVAFDQKTYAGETGWGAIGVQQGSQITVLYNPENPARSHPLSGFVFYSFR